MMVQRMRGWSRSQALDRVPKKGIAGGRVVGRSMAGAPMNAV